MNRDFSALGKALELAHAMITFSQDKSCWEGGMGAGK